MSETYEFIWKTWKAQAALWWPLAERVLNVLAVCGFAYYCWAEKPYGAAFLAFCLLVDEIRESKTVIVIKPKEAKP